MMKCEFEEMIGKEITAETYAIYEAMYLAAPETVDKKTFVSMLNIEAIPEAPEAIERRERNEARKADIREKIAELQERKAIYKKDLAETLASLAYWKQEGDAEMVEYLKRTKKADEQSIKFIQAEINEQKFLLTA